MVCSLYTVGLLAAGRRRTNRTGPGKIAIPRESSPLHMTTRMAQAVRAWVARLHKTYADSLCEYELIMFSAQIRLELATKQTNLHRPVHISIMMDRMDVDVLRYLFLTYNTAGMSMPRYLREREIGVALPALQIGVREFQDAVVVWAGPTLHDAQFMVVFERHTALVRRERGGPFIMDKMTGAEHIDLNFYLLPRVNAVGLVLTDGVLAHLWTEVSPGLVALDMCTNAAEYEVTFARSHIPSVGISLPCSAWQALVSHLNPTAVFICDAKGVNQQYRAQVENFIRKCIHLSWSTVSDAEIAQCLVWKMQKNNTDQLFAVFVHEENETVYIGPL